MMWTLRLQSADGLGLDVPFEGSRPPRDHIRPAMPNTWTIGCSRAHDRPRITERRYSLIQIEGNVARYLEDL